MKIDYYKDKVVIYLINKKVKLDVESIKDLLFDVFDTLTKDYDFKLDSSYMINIYINYIYGIVVELLKTNIDYDDDTINIKLSIMDDKLFLYEIDDPLTYLNNEIYFYDNKYYLNIKDIDIKLLEYASVIYDDMVYKILGRGVKI